jgi:hypothetical protein
MAKTASPFAMALPPALTSTLAVAVGAKRNRPSPARVVAASSTPTSRSVPRSSQTR